MSSTRYAEFFNVTKVYPSPHGPVVVVEDFNLTMARGEFVALIGHSGCGKSTVLSMIAGLNDITSGSIAVAEHEIRGPGPDRGVVFQSPSLLGWMTAYENVLLGVETVLPRATAAERRAIVEYYLEVVGLADSMTKYPRELSGGMQQRVGIARAFALSPKMLLLDEPFGMLDTLTRMELHEVLIDLLKEEDGKTILMVTHDVDEAIYLSDRVVMMTNGPRAKIGQILEVPFERPRDRQRMLDSAEYYALRQQLIAFLEKEERRRESASAA